MPNALDVAPSLQHSFTFLLRTCSEITERRGLKASPGFASARESFIIAVCAETNGQRYSQLDLAEMLNINPNMMVRIIDAMEKRQLVKRERNLDKRQANYLQLLPKGRKLYESWKGNIIENPEIVSPLNLKEREQLRQLLLKMVAAALLAVAI